MVVDGLVGELEFGFQQRRHLLSQAKAALLYQVVMRETVKMARKVETRIWMKRVGALLGLVVVVGRAEVALERGLEAKGVQAESQMAEMEDPESAWGVSMF